MPCVSIYDQPPLCPLTHALFTYKYTCAYTRRVSIDAALLDMLLCHVARPSSSEWVASGSDIVQLNTDL